MLPLEIIIWLQSLQNWFWDFLFNTVSLMGEEEFYIIVLGAIYWIINKRFGEYLGVSMGATLTLNNTLKGLFNMPRPFQEYPDKVKNLREYTATGSAFPSGHVQGSSSLFFGIYYFTKKRLFLIIAISVTILMMFSRMYLGVHYIQDVITGALIGLGIAYVHYYFFNKFKENDTYLHRYYLVIIALFIPAIILFNLNDLFKAYGILVGVIIAIIFEKKYVQFTLDIPILKKIVRLIIGLVLMMSTLMIVKIIFGFFGANQGTLLYNILDFIRYFLVALVGFGLYPWCFKRLKF